MKKILIIVGGTAVVVFLMITGLVLSGVLVFADSGQLVTGSQLTTGPPTQVWFVGVLISLIIGLSLYLGIFERRQLVFAGIAGIVKGAGNIKRRFHFVRNHHVLPGIMHAVRRTRTGTGTDPGTFKGRFTDKQTRREPTTVHPGTTTPTRTVSGQGQETTIVGDVRTNTT